MGVTGKGKNQFEIQDVKDEIDLIEDYMSDMVSSDQPAADSADPTASNASPKSRRNAKFYKKFLDRTVRSKRKGVRQARRTENLSFLMNLSEQDEPEVTEMDFIELIDHNLTPFAELFKQHEKMQIWNDFINRTEDEQMQILEGGQKEAGQLAASEPEDPTDKDKSWEELQWQDSWDTGDQRTVHPAFSAEDCFKKIDRKIKSLLKKKHLPLGILTHLEDDVISFFDEWPNSVYVSELASSFERMLLHALCQYLDLSSQSFSDEEGKRQTQVENSKASFVLPSMKLSAYLEYRDGKQ